ncbi:MAG: O-antigen polymerase [Candidatus Helarchaeota archaeon]
MEKNKDFFIILSIGGLFSLLSYIISNNLVFSLFFELVYVISMTILFKKNENKDFRVKINSQELGNIISIISVTLSLSLFFIYYFSEKTNFFFGLLYFIFIFFCPGYQIQRIFFYSKKLTIQLAYSILFSYFINNIIWYCLNPFQIQIRVGIILSVNLIIQLLGIILKYFKERRFAEQKSKDIQKDSHIMIGKKNLISILLVLCFYLFIYITLYPDFIFLENLDISRHYSYSLILLRSPELTKNYNYFFAHNIESLFITLLKNNIINIQGLLFFTNFFIILGIVLISKSLFKEKYKKLTPILIILFFLTSSGFSWIIFAILKIFGYGNPLEIMNYVNILTFNSLQYGLYTYWAPINLNYFFICVLIYEIFSDNRKSTKLIINSLIMIAIYLTHFSEGFLLTIFICLIGFIFPKYIKKSLHSVLISFIIGPIVVLFSYLYFNTISKYGNTIFNSNLIISISLSIIGSVFVLLWPEIITIINKFYKRSIFQKYNFISFIEKKKKFVLLSIIFIAFFLDFLFKNKFSNAGYFPVYLIPNFLGLNGIVFLVFFAKTKGKLNEQNNSLKILFYSIFSIFLIGRSITIISSFIIPLSYWERRIVVYLKYLSSFISILIISIFLKRKKFKLKSIRRKSYFYFLIGLILFTGFETNTLAIQNWKEKISDRDNLIDNEDLEAIYFMNNVFSSDTSAWIFTLTHKTLTHIDLIASSDRLIKPYLLRDLSTNEMILRILYRNDIVSHPYLYLRKDDFTWINNSQNSFLSFLLSQMDPIFKNSEVSIYNITNFSMINKQSDTVLVLPLKNSLPNNSINLIQSLLSSINFNYTTASSVDNSIFSYPRIILSYDPLSNVYNSSKGLNNLQSFVNYTNSGGELFILNANGYQGFSELLLNCTNRTLFSDKISENSGITIDLNTSIPMQEIIANNNQSIYTSDGNLTSSFISKMIFGMGEITYINIYPLISNIGSLKIGNSIKTFLDSLNIPKNTEIKDPFDMGEYCKNITLEDYKMKISSIYSYNSKIDADISFNNGTTISIKSSDILSWNIIGNLSLEGNECCVYPNNNYAFYANASINSSFSINPENFNDNKFIINFKSGEKIYENFAKITFLGENINYSMLAIKLHSFSAKGFYSPRYAYNYLNRGPLLLNNLENIEFIISDNNLYFNSFIAYLPKSRLFQ